jgi:hypothetical protein
MYKIDKASNTIHQLEMKSFSSLGFRERDHLQEWIAQKPSVLGEELLIIQKEFSGFDETQERLDLLALDKQGALVIIENKLDDSGKDVTWQALKYASYCSGFTKNNIAKIYQQHLDKHDNGASAEERLTEFFGGVDFDEIRLNQGVTQRIILIAAKFRKEVTSTVLWLMNYKVQIQCFRAIPYAMEEDLFLLVEQIIPTKDTEDFMIGMADKVHDELSSSADLKNRHLVRREFWTQLLPKINSGASELFTNVNPATVHYLGAGSGISRIRFVFVVSRTYGRSELYIDRSSLEQNEYIFDHLYSHKRQIESDFGGDLQWERLDGHRACRIKAQFSANVFDRDAWPIMIESMTKNMEKLEHALKNHLLYLGQKLKEDQ